MTKKPKWKPYLMRGAPVPNKNRPTSVDKADDRVPEVRPRLLKPSEIRRHRMAVHPHLRGVFLALSSWGLGAGDGPHIPRLAQPQLTPRVPKSTSVLSDDNLKKVDDELRASPEWAKRFIRLYFRYGYDPDEMVEALSLPSRQAFYAERSNTLFYFLGRFHVLGIPVHDPGYDFED